MQVNNDRKQTDNWAVKLADRSAFAVRFFDHFKPVGEAGIANFVRFVSHVSGEKFPSPLAAVHCPLSTYPMTDARLVFASQSEAQKALTIMSKVDFSKIKVVSLCYIDIGESEKNVSNDNFRVVMEQHGDAKSLRRVSKDNAGAASFTKNDPFKTLLEKMERRAATPPCTESTPMPSPVRLSPKRHREGDDLLGLSLDTKKSPSKRRISAPAQVAFSPGLFDTATNRDEKIELKGGQLPVENGGGVDAVMPNTREEAEARVKSLEKQIAFLDTLKHTPAVIEKVSAAVDELDKIKEYISMFEGGLEVGVAWTWEEMKKMTE